MTKTASASARELPAGPELDALFFETCWGWHWWSFPWEFRTDERGKHETVVVKWLRTPEFPSDQWRKWGESQKDGYFGPSRPGDPIATPYMTRDGSFGTMMRFEPCPPVSTDAAACEAWAMRWLREQEGVAWVCGPFHARVFRPVVWRDAFESTGAVEGTDWKHALVRACIIAAEALTNQPNGE